MFVRILLYCISSFSFAQCQAKLKVWQNMKKDTFEVYLSVFLLLIGSRRNANLAIYIINHINLIALRTIAMLNMQLSPCRSLFRLFSTPLIHVSLNLCCTAFLASVPVCPQNIKSIKASALHKSVSFTFLTLFCLFFVR